MNGLHISTEVDISGMQPPQLKQSPPGLAATWTIQGNPGSFTGKTILSNMTGGNLSVTSGAGQFIVEGGGLLQMSQSNSDQDRNSYGGITVSASQTTPVIKVTGGEFDRYGGGSVQITNAPIEFDSNASGGRAFYLSSLAELDVNGQDANGTAVLFKGGSGEISANGPNHGLLAVGGDVTVKNNSTLTLDAADANYSNATALIANIIPGLYKLNVGNATSSGEVAVFSQTSGGDTYAGVGLDVVFGAKGFYSPYYWGGTGPGGGDVSAVLVGARTIEFNAGATVGLWMQNTTKPSTTSFYGDIYASGGITLDGALTVFDTLDRGDTYSYHLDNTNDWLMIERNP